MVYTVCKGKDMRQMKTIDRPRNSNSDIFWTNVEMMLEQRGVQWKQFAENLNIDRSTIASMKSRSSRLSLDTVVKVAENLGVSIDRLMQPLDRSRSYYGEIWLNQDEFDILSGYKAVKNKSYYTGKAVYDLVMGVINRFRNDPIPSEDIK